MGSLNLLILDATGSKRQEVQLPDNATIERIMPVLLDRMNLPTTDPGGQPLSYKFHHKRTGKQLQESQTLAEAGVQEGDTLRIQPEITAG